MAADDSDPPTDDPAYTPTRDGAAGAPHLAAASAEPEHALPNDDHIALDPAVQAHRPGCSARAVPARLPGPFHNGAAVAAPDGAIYLVGGNHDHGASLEPAKLVHYDPIRGTYRSLPAAPEMFWDRPAAAFAGGKLIALDRKLWLFDPQTERWSAGRTPPEELINRCAATGPDGRVYFFGGGDNLGLKVDRAHAYDPSTDTWQDLPKLPFLVDSCGAAVSGGKIYVIERLAVVFDPRLEQWSTLPEPPSPRQHTTATTDADGRIVHVSGFGYDRIGYSTATDIYDPRSERWIAGPRLPEGLAMAASASTCSGEILVFGGDRVTSILSSTVYSLSRDGEWLASP